MTGTVAAVDEPLCSGQLVRFLETTSRWYFARVRRVRGEEVELVFFDGSKPIWSGLDQIETVEEFFRQRGRTFSRTREQLTGFFYGRGLQRLRAERFREMQKVLRKAGIAFHPEAWPQAETRIQIWPDDSVVERDDIDPVLAGLLPQWIEPFVLPTGSRDPLGLQAPAERLVNEVLPGLTVFTSRAGYYGFLTWAIQAVNSLARERIPRGTRHDVLNALERALVLCEFVQHGLEDDSCAVIGSRSKVRVLAGAKGDRYRVPESILKNQNSAGSFRLFATSLVSLGLATEADELIADGLLPYQLTDGGKSLAKTFGTRIDAHLLPFALGERSEERKTIKAWGKKLCFSEIASMTRFRAPLLEGMLLGNGRDAEKRYATISELFASGLLESEVDVDADDALGEDDAVLQEGDLHGASVSNLEVVLHFYASSPSAGERPLQALAVFELLSLGLSALFRAALVNATEAGKVDPIRLARSIALHEKQKAVWSAAMCAAKPRTVPKLVDSFFDTEDVLEAASIGGALLVRVLQDRVLPTVMDALSHHAREPLELVERCLRSRMERPLKDLVPDLLTAMVERHEVVSKRKNRQRWLCMEGDTIVRDDPQQMGTGLHALRFPQLGSLIRDLGRVSAIAQVLDAQASIRDALLGFAPRQPLRAALFLTYAFDGRWFEEALVPDLCDRPIATMLVIRDRNAITSEAPSVRYRKVNAGSSAVFHPKLVLLVAEDRARAVISSANLTRGGYERQSELGRVFDLGPEQLVDRAVFVGLADYLAKGVSSEVRGDSARQLNEIVEALREVVRRPKGSSGPHALLHNYERPIWDQVLERLPHRHLRRAVIVSPFFEPDRKRPEDPPLGTDDTSILSRLVFEDFEFETPKHEPSIQLFFRQSEGRTELPVRKLQKLADRVAFFAQDERQRRLHAKLVLLEGAEGPKRAPFLVALHGSPNFTSAGLLRIPPHGNSELAILTTLPAKKASFSQSAAALGLSKGFTRVEDLRGLKVEASGQPPTAPGQGIADSTYRVAENAVSFTFLQPTPVGARVRVLLLRDGAWISIGEVAASGVSSVVVPVQGLAEIEETSKLLELRGMSLRVEIIEASGAITSSEAPINVDVADEFCGLTLVGPALLTLDERIARAGIGVTATYREQQQWLEERKASKDLGAKPSLVTHQADLDRFYRNIHQGLRGLVKRCEGSSGSEFSARRSLDELSRWGVEAVVEADATLSRECRLFLIERLLKSMRSVLNGASPSLAPRLPEICADLRLDTRLLEVVTWLESVKDPALAAYAAGARSRAAHIVKMTKRSVA